jgi:hypothetical protein
MVLAAVVVFFAVQFGALSGRRPEPVEEVARLIHQHRTGGEPVGQYQVFVRNLGFYTGLRHESLFDDATAAAFLRTPDRVLLVARADDLVRIEAITGVRAPRLGMVRYLNAANVRLRTLIDPDPARELETVVLVSNR